MTGNEVKTETNEQTDVDIYVWFKDGRIKIGRDVQKNRQECKVNIEKLHLDLASSKTLQGEVKGSQRLGILGAAQLLFLWKKSNSDNILKILLTVNTDKQYIAFVHMGISLTMIHISNILGTCRKIAIIFKDNHLPHQEEEISLKDNIYQYIHKYEKLNIKNN